ncbi:MAG: hypothetical protein R3Y06_05010 [Faecalibacterium sp.]
MKVIEQFLRGKRSDITKCEDCIVVADAFVAVIDGVTAKNALLVDDKSTGRIAAELVAQAIDALAPDATIEIAVEAFTQKLVNFYETHAIEAQARENVNDRLAASVIVYSAHRKEVWSIGDCQCAINGRLYDFSKKIDKVISEARALYVEGLLINGACVAELLEEDVSRTYIEPLIRVAASFQNTEQKSEFAYGVIDGFMVPATFFHSISVNPGDEIILASDGYPCLKKTLEESELALSVHLRDDPLCYQSYKSTKGVAAGNCSYDDRAYVRFII